MLVEDQNPALCVQAADMHSLSAAIDGIHLHSKALQNCSQLATVLGHSSTCGVLET